MIDRLENRQRALIVGSAPGVIVPPPIPNDFVIAANGAAAIVTRSGRFVDCLCTTSYLFRPGRTEPEERTIESLRFLDVGVVLVDEAVGTATRVAFELQCLRVRATRIIGVGPSLRSEIITSVLGWPMRVSTGVWAACIAVAYGAPRIQVTGINPNANGHHGIPNDRGRRDHVEEDYDALVILQARHGVDIVYPEAA